MLKIGNVTIPSRCLLAPLSGVGDWPFRIIARSYGCEFAFTEMISARALSYHGKRTRAMLSTTPEDKPLGIQLVGNDPEVLRVAVEIVNQSDFSLLDFNAACPCRKVVRRGEGASLLKEPRKLHDLLKVLVTHSRIPVTVKIRSGWDEQTRNAREVVQLAQDAGVSAVFIHGRTKEQGYSGQVDYGIIRQVKKSVSIPVVASGDALSAPLVKRLFDETGCDGVAIARGAVGNPWIFRETKEFLKSGTMLPRPTRDEIVETMRRHLELCLQWRGERIGTVIFRKFFHWYTREMVGVKHLRCRAVRTKTKSQADDLLEAIRAQRPEKTCLVEFS